MSLKPRAADEVVPLPVLVLAEGAAVPSRVAAAARLARLASTVPATLRRTGGTSVSSHMLVCVLNARNETENTLNLHLLFLWPLGGSGNKLKTTQRHLKGKLLSLSPG